MKWSPTTHDQASIVMKKPRLIKILVFCIVLISLVLLVISGYFYVSYHTPLDKVYHSQGKNALWLRHQWVGKPHNGQEYIQLATLLKQYEITDAFFHVGPLNAQGFIEHTKYPYATQLVNHLKILYPELHIQAWIGQVEAKGGGPLDVSNASIQQNIIHTASLFLGLGFDGIHYNIEPIYSGDPHFIDLLTETKKITESQGKILSIASDEPVPFAGIEGIITLFAARAGFWNNQYYTEVAHTVDQIAVMMYDTSLPMDWLYGNVVRWVTHNLLTLLDAQMKDGLIMFMGVPTYEDQRWGFHPEAENVTSGIRGIQKGLERVDSGRFENFGIAMYAEWTTDQGEWDVYKQAWLNSQ
jgi:hypothetical protein